MLRLSSCSELDWGSSTVFIAKTRPLIGSIISKVAFYLNYYSIRFCVKYSCLVWPGALYSYLDVLDKLQTCKTVRFTFLAAPKPLANSRNVPSQGLFYK